MRVISKKRLKEFWNSRVGKEARGALEAWHTIVSHRTTVWTCWADLKRDYPKADMVGDCVVFDIGGNKFRLITRIRFPIFVFVLKVMTHAEYDTKKWQTECGCFEKPNR